MDTESLLRSLNAHNVRYVIIGATAFPVHGYARATLDIDIFIEATEENATRVIEALRQFGYCGCNAANCASYARGAGYLKHEQGLRLIFNLNLDS